jgi:hypothetical protein
MSRGKRPPGRPRRRWVDLLEVDWGGVDGIGIAQDRDKWRALVNAPSGSINFWETIE